MIDDDDVTFWFLAGPVIGPISAVVFVFVLLGLAYYAAKNEDECRARKCESGISKLLDGECVCVAGEPKPW